MPDNIVRALVRLTVAFEAYNEPTPADTKCCRQRVLAAAFRDVIAMSGELMTVGGTTVRRLLQENCDPILHDMFAIYGVPADLALLMAYAIQYVPFEQRALEVATYWCCVPSVTGMSTLSPRQCGEECGDAATRRPNGWYN